MGTKTASANSITLKGSTEIVSEFFGYAINSILYQRAIYPPKLFEKTQKYGLPILVTCDPSLKAYIQNVLAQLSDWLQKKTVQRVVVVVSGANSNEVLERWQFDIECDKTASDSTVVQKTEKEIHGEIQSIIRQITASVTFLPVIDEPAVFEILIYTDKDALVPQTWAESDPKYVKNAQEVFPLRAFSTKIHTVTAAVMFRSEE